MSHDTFGNCIVQWNHILWISHYRKKDSLFNKVWTIRIVPLKNFLVISVQCYTDVFSANLSYLALLKNKCMCFNFFLLVLNIHITYSLISFIKYHFKHQVIINISASFQHESSPKFMNRAYSNLILVWNLDARFFTSFQRQLNALKKDKGLFSAT
mgnify:CR=1 FL=1